MHDWGSRDATFLKINREVLTRLPEIVNGGGGLRHGADAGLGHVRRRGDADDLRSARTAQVLMLINGAYGHRAKKILDIARRKVVGARDAGGHAARSRARSSAC